MKEKWKDYIYHLRQQERSIATCRQYQRDILQFCIMRAGRVSQGNRSSHIRRGCGKTKEKRKAAVAPGDDLRNGHTGIGTALYHSGGSQTGGSGHSAQGENPRDSAVR